MSIETSKQNISSKVQGISDKLNVGAMPLLSKPSVSFGRSYFAQTEVLNLPTAGEDVISGYKDLNLKAALDENDQLKKLIQSLKEDFSTLIPILLGVGGVLAVLPSAKAEELMDQLSSGDLSNLTEDDLNNMVAMAEPAPTTDAYFDGTTPTEDAFRESQQLTVMKGTPLISELISLGESSGNYDITFGGNKYQSPESFSGGKKLTEMTLSEVMAFQNQRNSTVRNTGAVGKYQFISSTLKALVQQSGMNPNTTKFTPEVQEQLQSLLLRQNIKDLQKKGIIVTPANLSLAHYVGTGGVAAVQKAIENGDGDLSVRDAILKYTGKDVGAQNEELIRTKAKDFEKMQSTKLERKDQSNESHGC